MTRKLLILLLASMLFISGCEMMGGFGRDMQKTGSWIERTAD